MIPYLAVLSQIEWHVQLTKTALENFKGKHARAFLVRDVFNATTLERHILWRVIIKHLRCTQGAMYVCASSVSLLACIFTHMLAIAM